MEKAQIFKTDCLLEKKKKKKKKNVLRTFLSAKLFANYCHYPEKQNINAFLDENTHPLCKGVKNSNAHYR